MTSIKKKRNHSLWLWLKNLWARNEKKTPLNVIVIKNLSAYQEKKIPFTVIVIKNLWAHPEPLIVIEIKNLWAREKDTPHCDCDCDWESVNTSWEREFVGTAGKFGVEKNEWANFTLKVLHIRLSCLSYMKPKGRPRETMLHSLASFHAGTSV